MKLVICKSNKGWERLPLTIGGMYNVIEKSGVILNISNTNIPFSSSRPDYLYKVKCDNGEEKWIESNRFRDLTLEEKRDLKLKELGI